MNEIDEQNAVPEALEFLATGARQHVFVSRGAESPGWVYKVPAAFGYLLPLEHHFSVLRPKTPYERVLRLIAVRIPQWCERLLDRLSPSSEFSKAISGCGSQKLPGVARGPRAQGLRLVAWHGKRENRAQFYRMLRILELMRRCEILDLALPCSHRRSCRTVLHLDQSTLRYTGPVLIQRRADYMFQWCERFSSFDWDQLVTAQQRMWRYGLGFSAVAEVHGPTNWALWNGRLFLADTSDLTQDYDTVLAAVRKLDRAVDKALRYLGDDEDPALAEAYFRFIRRHINPETLASNWRTERPGR